MKMRSYALVLATLLATTPVAAAAQSTVNTTDPVYTEREDDDEFPWGLLGLLGLAGLLGLKRRDDDRVNRTGTTDRR